MALRAYWKFGRGSQRDVRTKNSRKVGRSASNMVWWRQGSGCPLEKLKWATTANTHPVVSTHLAISPWPDECCRHLFAFFVIFYIICFATEIAGSFTGATGNTPGTKKAARTLRPVRAFCGVVVTGKVLSVCFLSFSHYFLADAAHSLPYVARNTCEIIQRYLVSVLKLYCVTCLWYLRRSSVIHL